MKKSVMSLFRFSHGRGDFLDIGRRLLDHAAGNDRREIRRRSSEGAGTDRVFAHRQRGDRRTDRRRVEKIQIIMIIGTKEIGKKT